jgi:hypothetical protein
MDFSPDPSEVVPQVNENRPSGNWQAPEMKLSVS